MIEQWNERYSTDEYIYGKEPNEYFKKIIDGLKPGRLLLPSEGEGRNAVYAAKEGWKVTALDFSVKAKEKAIKFADEENVEIEYIVTPVEKYSYPENEFDAVALIYAHYPPDIRNLVHNSVVKSLKPGGIFIIEAFNKKQINNNSGGPKELSLLYDVQELKNEIANLNFIEAGEYIVELFEGNKHVGKADVIRILGKKFNKN